MHKAQNIQNVKLSLQNMWSKWTDNLLKSVKKFRHIKPKHTKFYAFSTNVHSKWTDNPIKRVNKFRCLKPQTVNLHQRSMLLSPPTPTTTKTAVKIKIKESLSRSAMTTWSRMSDSVSAASVLSVSMESWSWSAWATAWLAWNIIATVWALHFSWCAKVSLVGLKYHSNSLGPTL